MAGTVLYVGDDGVIPTPNIWQPTRNCVVDFGILAFADVDAGGDAALMPGAVVSGQVDLLVDYAIKGTPCPMIYAWKVLRVAQLGGRMEASPTWPADDPDLPIEYMPDIVCAQLLDVPAKTRVAWARSDFDSPRVKSLYPMYSHSTPAGNRLAKALTECRSAVSWRRARPLSCSGFQETSHFSAGWGYCANTIS